MYEYKAVVNAIRASGAVNVSIDLGFGLGHSVSLPLTGISIKPDRLKTAVHLLRSEVPAGTYVILNSHKTEGGYTCTIYVEGQSMNVNDILVAEGLADPTEGGPLGKAK